MILSHHNGLMRWAVPLTMMVSKIREAVGDSLTLIVNGEIANEFDVFMALAIGADGVSVGRPLMDPLKENGPEGVVETIRKFTEDLKAMMI